MGSHPYIRRGVFATHHERCGFLLLLYGNRFALWLQVVNPTRKKTHTKKCGFIAMQAINTGCVASRWFFVAGFIYL